MNSELKNLSMEIENLVAYISETYEDSDLGFFVFSKDKVLLKSNQKADYFIDKFAFLYVEGFFNHTFFNRNFHNVLADNASYNEYISEIGLHFYFSPLRGNGEILGVILQIVEIANSFESNNTPPSEPENFNEHFLFLLNHLPVHVWLMNPAGMIFWQNETMRKFANLKADKMLIGDWVNIIHNEDLEEANRGFTEGLRSNEINISDYRMKDYDGKYCLFRTVAQPIINNDKQVSYWIGVNVNIDSYKEKIFSLENEFKNSTLKVKELTEKLELSEKKIFHSQKLDTISRLAGGIAHDFNNLLLVMGLSANIIELNDTEKTHTKETDLIQNAIKNAGKLASQLMTFSGKKPNLPTLIDIEEQFSAIELLVQKTLTDNIKLNIEIEPMIWPVVVDSIYLENSILNIILNAKDALEYTSNGKIEVSIKNFIQQDDKYSYLPKGDYVCIRISDNGKGIEKENLSKIFDPFFTTKEVGKGTGLGLSMVYGFVKQANGEIRVKSELNKGTTFEIYLPKAEMDESLDYPHAEKSENENLDTHYKILVVEDNPLVRNSVVRILESKGYICYTAFDAYAAFLYLKNGMEVDLILSDVMMPGNMSALDFFDSIRRENIKTPVLYTTGYAENVLVKNGRVLEDRNLLMKPFSIEELIERINLIITEEMKF